MSKVDTVSLKGTSHVVIVCGGCGVLHTVPEPKYDSCYRSGGFWTCPNGCSRGWDKGADNREIDELRRERDRLKQRTAMLEEDASLARVRAEKAEAKTRKLKKRAAAGTCPCCQRTFQNMATHMKRQHPEYVTDTGAKVVPLKKPARAAGAADRG